MVGKKGSEKELTPEERKALRDLKAEQGRTERREYMSRKKKIIQLEEKNLQYVYLVKSTGKDWCKIFGRSAVIYKYHLFPELIKRIKYKNLEEPILRSDADRDYNSKIGFISIRSKANFSERMKYLKLAEEMLEPGIFAYKMPTALTREEFMDLIEEDARRWEEVNMVIQPEVSMPTAAKEIREMSKLLYDFARKLQGDQKELIGKSIVKTAEEALETHYAVEKGHLPLAEYFMREKMLLDRLNSQITIAFDAQATTPVVAMRLAEKIDKVMVAVEKAERKKAREAKDAV